MINHDLVAAMMGSPDAPPALSDTASSAQVANVSSPVVLTLHGSGQFFPALCFFCGVHETAHRCRFPLDNGAFILRDQRICGQPFCHECSLNWGSLGNRNRCSDHLLSDTACPIPVRERGAESESVNAPPRESRSADAPPRKKPSVSSSRIYTEVEESTNTSDTDDDQFSSFAVGQQHEKSPL